MGTGAGHYAFRITVPDGGPRTLDVVIRGGRQEPVFLMEDPFTFRPVGEGTAQMAPAQAPVVPEAPAAPPAQPVTSPATRPHPAAAPTPALLAVALLGLGLLVAAVGLLVARSVRRSRPVEAPRQAPGA